MSRTIPRTITRTMIHTVAIQGELGSNSHMAALELLADLPAVTIVPCMLSGDVMEALASGRVDAAVLPIENTLHGSVAEHYDLLLEQDIRIDREGLLRVRHNVMAMPGVKLADVRRILSHPVALSQCRKFLAQQKTAHAEPFYDTAGSVKHVMEQRLPDTAAIAPVLAAEVYGAEVLVAGVEDHAQNYTRFHLLRRASDASAAAGEANKLSLALSLEHRPGSLVRVLETAAAAGANLTKIESRPVPGKPFEYIFYVDLRFAEGEGDAAFAAVAEHCVWARELGRYRGAEL